MFSTIFKKLFFSSNTKTELADNKSIEDANAITIILDSNNEPYIHIAITELDIDKAINFGKTLSDLNHGYYVTSITNLLLQLAKEDNSMHLFIKNVLSSWSLQNKINSSVKNNEPIIRPTDFIKSLKNE